MAVDPKKIFVGGLNGNTTDGSLQQYFQTFGAVPDSKVIMDRDTEQSKGFGLVEFADSQTVDAILGQGGHSIDGQQVKVNTAKARGSGGGGRGGGGGGYGGGRGGYGGGGGGYGGGQGYGGGGGGYGGNQGYGGGDYGAAQQGYGGGGGYSQGYGGY